jgi:excisionase family DNA binding protein
MGLKGAAGYLNCHPETVRSLVLSDQLKGVKVGRAWVFKESDLSKYLDDLYHESSTAKELTQWNYSKDQTRRTGNSASRPHSEDKYSDLLKKPIKRKPE